MATRALIPICIVVGLGVVVGTLHFTGRDVRPREPVDPDDIAAMRALAEDVGLPFHMPDLTPVRRDPDWRNAPQSNPVAPVGAIRAGFVTEFRIDLHDVYEGDRPLEFRAGNDVLFREDPFDPENTVTVRDLPVEVLDRVNRGAEITWGVPPDVATFRVVDGAPAQRAITAMRTDPRLARQSPGVLDVFELHLLIEHGLCTEAIQGQRELSDVTDRHRWIVVVAARQASDVFVGEWVLEGARRALADALPRRRVPVGWGPPPELR